MNWNKGTYFSIAVFGYRSYWIVLDDLGKHARCLFLKGCDPRLIDNSKEWIMHKSWFSYTGKVEKPTLRLKYLHWRNK